LGARKVNLTLKRSAKRIYQSIRETLKMNCLTDILIFIAVWRIMLFVYDLVQKRKKVTQRELYYCLLPTFATQSELNERIQGTGRVYFI